MMQRRSALILPIGLATPRLAIASGQEGPDVLLVLMSDLHSAMERAPAAMAAIEAALAAQRGTPALIVINGDVFERGNVVALRSEGAADWAFLAALRRLAPVVLNLGNHETALLDDPALVVARARSLDLIVLSNMRNRRDGAPYAPASHRWALPGGRALTLVGVATDEVMTYRAPVRPLIDLPEPAAWARAELPALLAGADAAVVLSHAGVAADRAMLPLLPPGGLLVGGHEHLRFAHTAEGVHYVHTGSWNRFVTLAGLHLGPRQVALREIAIEPGVAEDAGHAALVREVMAAHLTPAETEIIARRAAAMPLPQAARFASAAVASATGADAALLANTSFGTGLPAGEVTRFAFDAFIRFDGPLFAGVTDAPGMAGIAARANQDGDMPLVDRVGDFVFAHRLPAGGGRIASNGWVRLNAPRYLGLPSASLSEVPALRFKQVVADALRG